MLKNLLTAISAVAGVAIFAGCVAGKEGVAIAKTSSRSKPGYVRLLNLSSDGASMFDRGRRMIPPVSTNSASGFTTFPSGDRTMLIKGVVEDLDVKMELKPEVSALIVLGSSGKTSSMVEDLRVPQNGHNLKLIYLESDGSVRSTGPPVSLANSGSRVVLSAAVPAVAIPEGSWKVSANDLLKSEPLTVVPNTVYDLVLVKGARGRYFEVVLSHLFVVTPKIGGMGKTH